MKRVIILPLVFMAALLLIRCNSAPENADPLKPNIILIMGDDIGYSDIGCYGSEIKTPNLDGIAEHGMRFTTFYNGAKCNPTRSSLLTGLYYGNDRAVNISKLLHFAGYTSIFAGKEHYDSWVPQSCFAANSFDYSFTFWVNNEFHIPPDSSFQNPYYLNGKELALKEIIVEKPPFFKTDVVTDYALRFLEETKQDEGPFFLYLPYHAAHYPLQARPEDIARYQGKYKKGWDKIRKERYDRMLRMGIIDNSYILSQPTDNINKFRGHPEGDEEKRKKIPLYRPWNQLTEKEKDDLDLEMAVFAAMIDRMDQNIGRVLNWLKENDQYENTLIMYLSDNGSCPYDSNRDFDHPPGPADSYRTLSAAWANVGNTPFRYFKQFGHEGGSHTHFIVQWPGIIETNSITAQPGHVVDILPTLLDITGVEYPNEVNGLETIPLSGNSLYPVFRGEERVEPEYFISGNGERFRMFRMGHWKIVKANDMDWELYNMEEDKTELYNLADSLPGKVGEMEEAYERVRKNQANWFVY